MSQSFALDLKAARRKSGLTQHDCAHLLATQRSKISRIETGRHLPSAYDIACLSLIHGRTYDALCRTVFEDAARDLKGRLITLPDSPRSWLGRFNRTNTIANLEARLKRLTSGADAAV